MTLFRRSGPAVIKSGAMCNGRMKMPSWLRTKHGSKPETNNIENDAIPKSTI